MNNHSTTLVSFLQTFLWFLWLCCSVIISSIALPVTAVADQHHDINGSVLLRYEDDFDHRLFKERERLRLIADLGLNSDWSEHWFSEIRLSTGLKNKQNVPAITIYRFNSQPSPDDDVFLNRYYLGYRSGKFITQAGKVPWQIKHNTDMFWDMNLNPYGITARYDKDNNTRFDGGFIKPLDGKDDTVGTLIYLAARWTFPVGQYTLTLAPWFVDYQGEENAEHATRDTQFDNRSIRLGATLAAGPYKLGLDIGHSLDDFAVLDQFKNEKTAWIAQLKYGNLKKPGNIDASVRWLHVERFGVITEFAQNGTSRTATSNFEGYELRLRYKIQANWWVGARFSDITTLVGIQREGKRFRFETKYSF